MSRSRRKTPITGVTTAHSEAFDKKCWHRGYRHACRRAIQRGDAIMPDERDHSDPWSFSKDGKVYWGSRFPKGMRK